MSKKASTRKGQVFEQEYEQLRAAQEVVRELQSGQVSFDQLNVNYRELASGYERLLDDSRLITSVSDRLQNKLNRANDEVKAKNEELQKTIDLLTAARAGRKAAMYVLVLAIVLFILSETIIEPQIDDWVRGYKGTHQYDFWISLFFKGLIAVMLKPLEGMIERFMVRREIEKQHQAQDAARASTSSNKP